MTTTTSILSRKLQHLFRLLDSDHDGYLARHDLSVRAEALAAPFAAPPEKVHGLRDALYHIWDAYLRQMDEDGDGKLTSTEYEHGMRAALDGDATAFIDSLHDARAAWRALFEPGRDGHLSFNEYAKLVQGMGGIAPGDAEKAFRHLDHDADGSLRPDEARTAVVEFFTSEDPKADGNWLYGPL